MPSNLVHVVAWQYSGGAGFDSYTTPKSANDAFEVEKKNVAELAADDWTAFRFDVKVPEGEDIAAYIDAQFDELCAQAELKAGPITFPYTPANA